MARSEVRQSTMTDNDLSFTFDTISRIYHEFYCLQLLRLVIVCPFIWKQAGYAATPVARGLELGRGRI